MYHHHGGNHGLLRRYKTDHTRSSTGSVEKHICLNAINHRKDSVELQQHPTRGALSLVDGVGRFHTYLYGRSLTIITYHKPLEMICNKQISSGLPRLQMMLVKIQGYDYSGKYRPGNEMIVPDVLPRLPSPSERL